jgi:hypothetical protein
MYKQQKFYRFLGQNISFTLQIVRWWGARQNKFSIHEFLTVTYQNSFMNTLL